MRDSLERYFARRVPASRAPDLVQDVMAELVKKLGGGPTTTLLPSWFGPKQPPVVDAAQFRSVVWRTARSLLLDDLRHVYASRRVFADRIGLDAPQGVDEQGRVDAHLMLAHLTRLIDSLSTEDRALLLGSALEPDDDSSPMSVRTRVHLHRLRKLLAQQIWDELENPRPETQTREPEK